MTELSIGQKFDKPIVIGLGFFDCVHLGHRALIARVTEYAQKNGCVPVIATFMNNPYRLFNPDARVVNTYAERLTTFASLGINHVLPLKFDAEFKKTDKKDFLDMLFGAFQIKCAVCGYDYLFGFKGAGDVDYLRGYAAKKGAEVIAIEPVLLEGERVSSTVVKESVERGEIERANRFLGSPFFIVGEVAAGNGRGRSYGFPTANLSFKKSKLTPLDGVYKTRALVGGKRYNSVTGVGQKPTFSDTSKTVETYLDGFTGDLYGKELRVEFISRLRDIQKFDSAQSLAAQIKKDLAR